VPELRVRDEVSVDEEGGPDPGPERHYDDHAVPPASGSESHLRKPGSIGVVEDDDDTFESIAEQRHGVGPDP